MRGTDMSQVPLPALSRRFVLTALIGWLSMLGFDFFLHAGLLAGLYLRPSPFLLPPAEAFRRIPLGYLSFLLLAVMLLWLMTRLDRIGWRAGFGLGMKLGALIWGSLALGLLSVSTADAALLAGWFAGQTVELAIAGAVMGGGLSGERLGRLAVRVLAFVVLMIVVTVVLQSLGWAPVARL